MRSQTSPTRDRPQDDDESPPSLISPIACRFGDELLLGSIKNMSDLAASFARSAGECAWRGDLTCAEFHLREAKNAIAAAILTFDAIKKIPASTEADHG
jgi:hypothetical protein